MSAHDLVDAALAGLDQGETVTIPSLEDKSEWDAYDAARRAMAGNLSRTKPAIRYYVVSEEVRRASWEPAHY
jgi:short-subunit dehydrogenase